MSKNRMSFQDFVLEVDYREPKDLLGYSSSELEKMSTKLDCLKNIFLKEYSRLQQMYQSAFKESLNKEKLIKDQCHRCCEKCQVTKPHLLTIDEIFHS